MKVSFPPELLKYCTTARQREQYESLMHTGSYRATKMAMGYATHKNLMVLVENLKTRQKLGIYDPLAHSRIMVADETKIATKQLRVKKKARYVVTCAQNATPVFPEGLASLRTYCNKNKAELVVIPIRYHNPTSAWTKADESSDW